MIDLNRLYLILKWQIGLIHPWLVRDPWSEILSYPWRDRVWIWGVLPSCRILSYNAINRGIKQCGLIDLSKSIPTYTSALTVDVWNILKNVNSVSYNELYFKYPSCHIRRKRLEKQSGVSFWLLMTSKIVSIHPLAIIHDKNGCNTNSNWLMEPLQNNWQHETFQTLEIFK